MLRVGLMLRSLLAAGLCAALTGCFVGSPQARFQGTQTVAAAHEAGGAVRVTTQNGSVELIGPGE